MIAIFCSILFCTLIVTLAWWTNRKRERRVANVEERNRLVELFLYNRAIAEGVEKGYLKEGAEPGTWVATDSFLSHYATCPLQPQIKTWYTDHGKEFKNNFQRFLEIESQFGMSIVREICIPLDLNRGACIHGIVAALEGKVVA